MPLPTSLYIWILDNHLTSHHLNKNSTKLKINIEIPYNYFQRFVPLIWFDRENIFRWQTKLPLYNVSIFYSMSVVFRFFLNKKLVSLKIEVNIVTIVPSANIIEKKCIALHKIKQNRCECEYNSIWIYFLDFVFFVHLHLQQTGWKFYNWND